MIDTNNYCPQRDGHIAELDNESTTTAELLQAHLPTSNVVKAFNQIYAAELTTHGQPAGSKNRRALVVAGDDAAAKAVVTKLLDDFGFDAVDAGLLKEGRRIQRDTPGYGPHGTVEELRKDLAAAAKALTRDDVLDNISIAWLITTAISGARLYRESKLPLLVPMGVARF